MKVEKIIQSTTSNQIANSRKINLAGFGSTQPSASEQTTSFNNKKSNEAIKNQFLANLSFEGHRDKVKVTVTTKYGPTRILSTSGGLIKILPDGDPGYEYQNSNSYRVDRPIISQVFHAEMERGGNRAHGSSSSYVVREAITDSPYYYNGSTIKERYPISSYISSPGENRSVYFSDPGERMDERTPSADYIVYAPGAYYKERTFWEKL